ncbi:HyaD/HybD family hydrogenase maturation endopeptidase [Komagataeibacter kakiaceti JCM 25156]
MDGGTQGLYLLPHLEDLAGLVIVDAIDFGLPPATVHEVHGADVPATIGARKMSLHQTGFQEVLALLDLRGHAPRRVSLIGVQPVTMKDYGGGLTPAVAARVEPVARAVLDLLARDYGVTPRIRSTPDGEMLVTPAVARTPYETGRPDETIACRYGDERVLARMEG